MMKQISFDEAFGFFRSWSKDSLVGINFGRHDACVNVALRGLRLEVSDSALLLEAQGSSIVILRFDDGVMFHELTREDVKHEFAKLHPVNPKFQACVGAKFSNQDFCLIFAE